jgi:hypothetical protein
VRVCYLLSLTLHGLNQLRNQRIVPLHRLDKLGNQLIVAQENLIVPLHRLDERGNRLIVPLHRAR